MAARRWEIGASIHGESSTITLLVTRRLIDSQLPAKRMTRHGRADDEEHAVDWTKKPGNRFSTARCSRRSTRHGQRSDESEHCRGDVAQVDCAEPQRHQNLASFERFTGRGRCARNPIAVVAGSRCQTCRAPQRRESQERNRTLWRAM